MLAHNEKEFKVVDGEMKVHIKTTAHRITRKIHNPNSTSTVMSGIMRSWVVGVPLDSYRTGTKPDKFSLAPNSDSCSFAKMSECIG